MRSYREVVRLLAFVGCLALVATSAEANLILNASFEDGAFVDTGGIDQTMTLGVGSTTMTNWTVVVDDLAWIDTPNPWFLSAQDGTKFLDLTNYEPGPPLAGVTQTIATTAASNYLLSFYMGSYTDLWGGPVSILATAGSASVTCSLLTPTSTSTWTLCTMPFTALSASTAITLRGVTGAIYVGLDNVSVELADAVPEPLSILLLGTGAAGLLARGRRRRQTGA